MNKKIILWTSMIILLVSLAYAANPEFVNVANNDQFNASEDENFILFVEGNDSDVEYPLNFSDTSEDVMAVFSMANFNDTYALINFTPTNDDVAFYEFFLVVEDTADDFTTIRVKFNVTNVNDAPNITAVDPSPANVSVNENDSVGFSFNYTAADPDTVHGDVLTARWLLNGVNQSSDTTWTYLPGFCDSGNYNVTLNITDTSNASDSRTWNLTVNNTNRAPVNNGSLANQSWSEDTSQTNVFDLDDVFYDNDTISCTGINKDTITFSATGNSSIKITIDPDSNQVNLTPDANFFGVEYVFMTANDSYNRTLSNNITLNVTNVNDAPSLDTILNQTVAENVTFSMLVTASDPDNDVQAGTDTLTFYDNTSLFNINPSTGSIQFAPTPSDVANHSVNITVGDGNLNDSQIVYFNVISNNPPILNHTPNQTAEEATLFTYDINATDPDGDELTFLDNATFFSINSTSGVISFTPVDADVGNHTINITVNDSNGATDSEVINLSISDINNAPVLNTIANQTHTVGRNYSVNVTASDLDGNDLSYSDNSTFFNISKINATLATINYTPQSSDEGNHTILITVSDSLESDTQSVWFNIITNVSPVFFEIGNQTLTEDSSFVLNLTARDDNEDNLTFGSNSTLFNITYVNETFSNFSFTPRNADIGAHSIKFNVTDNLFVENQTVVFNITEFNDPPYFDPALTDLNSTEDTLFTYDVNATDEEGDSINYSSNSTIFTIDISSGLINFTPNNDDVGSYQTHINATDGNSVNSTTINFTVLNLNNAPNITSFLPNQSNISVIENTSISFNLTINDPDGDNLTYSWTLNGTEVNASQNWTYYPGFDDSGDYNLTVVVSDSSLEATNSWNLTVNNSNRNPEFGFVIQTNQSDFTGGTLEQTNETRESGNVTLDLQNSTHFHSSGNFTSSTIDFIAESDLYDVIDITKLIISRNLSNGTNITISTRTSSDGSTWENYTNSTSLTSFDVNSTDNRYLQYRANFTTDDTTITPVIEQVKIEYIIPNFTGEEDTKYLNWVDLDDYFSDPDGDSLTYNVTSGGSLDISIANGSNQVTLTPDSDWFGTVTVFFTAKDSSNSTKSNNVTLTFTDVAEPAGASTTVVAGGGGGGGGGGGVARTQTRLLNISEPQFLQLVTPRPLEGGPNSTLIAPILLRNNGNKTLQEIRMFAETNSTDISLQYSKQFIAELRPKQEINTDLIISTGASKGAHTIDVIAKVSNPNVEDSGIIFIDISENLTERVSYVRDLIKLHPECLELNEIVSQAQESMRAGDYTKGEELLQTVIDGCRYLVSLSGGQLGTPRRKTGTDIKLIISGITIILLFILMLIYRSMMRFYKKKR